jgi:hypothetical protein
MPMNHTASRRSKDSENMYVNNRLGTKVRKANQASTYAINSLCLNCIVCGGALQIDSSCRQLIALALLQQLLPNIALLGSGRLSQAH